MSLAVRNKDGYWINTELFKPAAKHFEKYGYYCDAPEESPEWFDFWEEERRRMLEGYSVGGAKITGHHYKYLNYKRILSYDDKAGRKMPQFPDFWDGDYDFFWVLDIARWGVGDEEKQIDPKVYEGLQLENPPKYTDGGYHIAVGKARQRGFSYKIESIIENIYSHLSHTYSIIGAYDKKYLYPSGTMSGVKEGLGFLSENTAFGKKRDFVDKQGHIRASYRYTQEDGTKVEKGTMSEVQAFSYKDNPDKSRSKRPYFAAIEESGEVPNLREIIGALKPSMREGPKMTGQIICFGTSKKDIEGSRKEFAEVFYKPGLYGFLPFNNIWDESSDGLTCSFFFPTDLCKPGYIDDQGNSDRKGAKEFEEEERNKIKRESSASSEALMTHVVEEPFSPEEAFKISSSNGFPTEDLKIIKNKLLRDELYKAVGDPVHLYRTEEGGIEAKLELSGDRTPLYKYDPDSLDLTGIPVIYEHPMNNPPRGLYYIGYDPYAQDQSDGPSLGAAVVYKTAKVYTPTHNTIVAEYKGRPETMDDCHEIVLRLAEYYNAEIMYENNYKDFQTYMKNRKKLDYLVRQPDTVINLNIKQSKVNRVYGCHMNDQLTEAGEKYWKKWLLTERDVDEKGETKLNLHTLKSLGIVEETIRYNRKGNFDMMSAIFMVMFAVKEDEKVVEKGQEQKKTNVDDWNDRINEMMSR